MSEDRNGRVITFYSYKGGTGRSMALANLACVLAQRNGGKRVLAVDWDLEAPGLHRYFRRYLRTQGAVEDLPGLIEVLSSLRESVAGEKSVLGRDKLGPLISRVDWESSVLPTDLPSLDFIKAGRFDASYSERINTFDWEALYKGQPNLFGAIADHLARQYDYVLVDSRTGLTDISGICTALLPDTIIAVFTPNRQSIDGALMILRRAANYRLQSDDLRPLQIFPLASRIELNEKKLQEAWRFGGPEDGKGYQAEFENLLKEVYGLENCDLKAYFNDAQIQYVPFYAFGEEIAVRSEVESNLSLARSYLNFADLLVGSQNPWEYTIAREPSIVPVEEIPWDEKWFETQRQRAAAKLENDGPRAYMQFRFSLPYDRISKSRLDLLEAARSAEDLSGWPLGIINGEPGPRPSADGIVAEVKHEAYNWWSLRDNGDCYLLRSLIEDEQNANRFVYFDFRIKEITKAILYCERLYEHLGLSPRTTVRIAVSHSGFAGRILGTSHLRYKEFAMPPHVSEVDSSEQTVRKLLGRLETDVVTLAKQILAPMFELFGFAALPDIVYEDVIERMRSRR